MIFFVAVFFHHELLSIALEFIENDRIQLAVTELSLGSPLLLGISVGLIPICILLLSKFAPLKSTKQGAILVGIILLAGFILLQLRLSIINTQLAVYQIENIRGGRLTYDIANTNFEEWLSFGLALGAASAFLFYRLCNKKKPTDDMLE
jgi:hypothetical protein